MKQMRKSFITRSKLMLTHQWDRVTDGEEIEGTMEWYDRGAIKVNRHSAQPSGSKRNIKYMYKADERVEQSAD
jgi:hypothetical protein